MKIDPVTGKAYLTEWQRNLDRIHHGNFLMAMSTPGLGKVLLTVIYALIKGILKIFDIQIISSTN